MPYRPTGIKNRAALTDTVGRSGYKSFGTKAMYGGYYNEMLIKSKQDWILGTEDQVKIRGLADVFYNGTNFVDKDDVIVVFVDHDRINVVIDIMERDVVFPSVKLNLINHQSLDLNSYTMTIPGEVGGRIDVNDNAKKTGGVAISGQSNGLKLPEETSLDQLDNDDNGHTHFGVFVQGGFIFVASGDDGLSTYSVDAAGILTFVDNDAQGVNPYNAVTGDGSLIFCSCGEDGIRSYSVDGSGILTSIDSDINGAAVYEDITFSNGYIFCACDDGIKSYSSDISGNLTFKDTDLNGIFGYSYIYADADFIYCGAVQGGLLTYSADISGNLLYIDTDIQAIVDFTNRGISGDGSYIFCAAEKYVATYSISVTGIISNVAILTIAGAVSQDSVWYDGNYFLVPDNISGKINVYYVDSSGSIFFIIAADISVGINDIYGDGTFSYPVGVTDGIYSFETIPGEEYALNFSGSGTLFVAGVPTLP